MSSSYISRVLKEVQETADRDRTLNSATVKENKRLSPEEELQFQPGYVHLLTTKFSALSQQDHGAIGTFPRRSRPISTTVLPSYNVHSSTMDLRNHHQTPSRLFKSQSIRTKSLATSEPDLTTISANDDRTEAKTEDDFKQLPIKNIVATTRSKFERDSNNVAKTTENSTRVSSNVTHVSSQRLTVNVKPLQQQEELRSSAVLLRPTGSGDNQLQGNKKTRPSSSTNNRIYSLPPSSKFTKPTVPVIPPRPASSFTPSFFSAPEVTPKSSPQSNPVPTAAQPQAKSWLFTSSSPPISAPTTVMAASEVVQVLPHRPASTRAVVAKVAPYRRQLEDNPYTSSTAGEPITNPSPPAPTKSLQPIESAADCYGMSSTRRAQQTFWDSYRSEEAALGSTAENALLEEVKKILSVQPPDTVDLDEGKSMSTVERNFNKRRLSKLFFAEDHNLVKVYEYPSETTFLEELGIKAEYDEADGDRNKDDDEEEDSAISETSSEDIVSDMEMDSLMETPGTKGREPSATNSNYPLNKPPRLMQDASKEPFSWSSPSSSLSRSNPVSLPSSRTPTTFNTNTNQKLPEEDATSGVKYSDFISFNTNGSEQVDLLF